MLNQQSPLAAYQQAQKAEIAAKAATTYRSTSAEVGSVCSLGPCAPDPAIGEPSVRFIRGAATFVFTVREALWLHATLGRMLGL